MFAVLHFRVLSSGTCSFILTVIQQCHRHRFILKHKTLICYNLKLKNIRSVLNTKKYSRIICRLLIAWECCEIYISFGNKIESKIYNSLCCYLLVLMFKKFYHLTRDTCFKSNTASYNLIPCTGKENIYGSICI
jgi:hypothetical protein